MNFSKSLSVPLFGRRRESKVMKVMPDKTSCRRKTWVAQEGPDIGSSFSLSSTKSPPSKYIKKNGVMKLNPGYVKFQKKQKQGSDTTVPKPKHALPIVSNLQDHEQLNSAAAGKAAAADDNTYSEIIPLAESTKATLEMMQDVDFAMDAGFSMEAPDAMVKALGSLLNKYEVPMGLLNKLMILSEFDSLEFLIDDSGSMNLPTDHVVPDTHAATGPGGDNKMTRWQEAQFRLQELMELLAYIPFTQIDICFLNRSDQTILTRKGLSPKDFLAYAKNQIDQLFSRPPSGTTPYLERLQESFSLNRDRRVARYFMGDGVPDGGIVAITKIQDILCRRQDPEGNPYTFLSCTDQDEQVEWMKDLEERAPYCSETDDFHDEVAEVLRDQGPALPYSRGFYLICSLVAAMNPDDLDAMDETVPFAKTTLDNLLGIEHDSESYRHYWDCFTKAQQSRVNQGAPSDKYKKHMVWTEEHYQHFLRAPVASQIPAVREYKQHIQRLDNRSSVF